MQYVVRVDIPPHVEPENGDPQAMQDLIGKWQALNPSAFLFSITQRQVTIIVDVPNEDAMFEALHATWVLGKVYPTVTPVVDVSEFGSLRGRIGMG